MKKPFLSSLPTHSALAVVAGLLWAAAFPKLNLPALAWIAPGLMIVAAGQSGSPFRIGYIAGFVFSLATLHWLLFIPITFLPIAAWIALSGYLALYSGCWAWICERSIRQRGSANFKLAYAKRSWVERAAWAFFCAATWVGLEMILGRFLSGFPWAFIGISQFSMLPLIQLASITGIYGVSFMVVWLSVALAGAAILMVHQSSQRRGWWGEITLPFLAVAAAMLFGLRQLRPAHPVEKTLRIALVQPSIPQTMIWSDRDSSTRFAQLLQLSELALATRPDLLVWPEAAVPKLLRYDQTIYDGVTNLVRRHHAWLILGVDDADPRDRNKIDYFNSSFLVSPEGNLVANYRKRRLVIFGEYVPLTQWLPFLKHLTPIQGGFVPGRVAIPFEIPALGVKVSVLICFEDVFPNFVREYVQEDTDFLLNLTNNGWFGESAAQWQHAAAAVFRAIENGLPLVRCANNGLTCWVDAHGRMQEVYFGNSSDIYGAGFKTARVPVLSGRRRPATVYNKYGDWFGWSCVALTALGLFRIALGDYLWSKNKPRSP